MGLLLSKFYDKPSTRDTLERIESEIQNIEERRWDKIKREQFVVQILSFIPITILIGTICILIYPSDSSWRDKLLLCVPAILLNLILLLCRKTVQWYSRWSLDNEETRLRKLHKEKKRILEMVCETESYRVAAELLEKYDPKQLRRRERGPVQPSSSLNNTLTKFSASPSRQLPQQHQANQSSTSFLNQSMNFPINASHLPVVPPTPTPTPAPPPPTPATKPLLNSNQRILASTLDTTLTSPLRPSIASPIAASSVQGRPVRPILTKDRTIFERLVDWVVADGPDNRFALICRYCYGHNGMSLAEEYETINFRCCYCYNLNTATNKRHQIHDQLQPEREKSEQGAPDDQVVPSMKGDGTKKVESSKEVELDNIKQDPAPESDTVESKIN